MTPPQTLESRASEMRARLSGLEDFTDETRAELASAKTTNPSGTRSGQRVTGLRRP